MQHSSFPSSRSHRALHPYLRQGTKLGHCLKGQKHLRALRGGRAAGERARAQRAEGRGAADGAVPFTEGEKLRCSGVEPRGRGCSRDFSGLRVEPWMGRWTFPASQGGWMLRRTFLLQVIHPAQPPWLRLPLATLSRGLLPSRAIPLLGRGGHQRWRPEAGQGGTFHLPPPCPAHLIYLTLACQLRLSNPGLGLLGQFPLNGLNPRLLRSQKLSLPTRSQKLLQRGCAVWDWLPGGSRAAVAAPYAAQPSLLLTQRRRVRAQAPRLAEPR